VGCRNISTKVVDDLESLPPHRLERLPSTTARSDHALSNNDQAMTSSHLPWNSVLSTVTCPERLGLRACDASWAARRRIMEVNINHYQHTKHLNSNGSCAVYDTLTAVMHCLLRTTYTHPNIIPGHRQGLATASISWRGTRCDVFICHWQPREPLVE